MIVALACFCQLKAKDHEAIMEEMAMADFAIVVEYNRSGKWSGGMEILLNRTLMPQADLERKFHHEVGKYWNDSYIGSRKLLVVVGEGGVPYNEFVMEGGDVLYRGSRLPIAEINGKLNEGVERRVGRLGFLLSFNNNLTRAGQGTISNLEESSQKFFNEAKASGVSFCRLTVASEKVPIIILCDLERKKFMVFLTGGNNAGWRKLDEETFKESEGIFLRCKKDPLPLPVKEVIIGQPKRPKIICEFFAPGDYSWSIRDPDVMEEKECAPLVGVVNRLRDYPEN